MITAIAASGSSAKRTSIGSATVTTPRSGRDVVGFARDTTGARPSADPRLESATEWHGKEVSISSIKSIENNNYGYGAVVFKKTAVEGATPRGDPTQSSAGDGLVASAPPASATASGAGPVAASATFSIGCGGLSAPSRSPS